ncbi:MAG TPA: pyrroloquinoline quinone biosynthesis protein PqqE [Anaeromyxobacteraceae bacterium]|nr:pyrroloquinoline quinone biosynthesis protein PqqE [Anaeromyxobacteraceae bacterium]
MSASAPRPVALVAELTHRCPLQCPYCSNPLELVRRGRELPAPAWARVLGEAEELGVLQVLLTGGEPLLRPDLEEIVAAARARELYATLITSGVPLRPERLRALADAGLDAVQLSFQGAADAPADAVAGVPAHARKLEAARWIKECGLPLTVNVVLHRADVEAVPDIVALAERVGADRLELATVQYLGFAHANRPWLRPSPEALLRVRREALAARDRLAGRMEVVLVAPDEVTDQLTPCMDGWGRRTIVVAPDGVALPCHHARSLPLSFASVEDRPLRWIWAESPGFRAFRGEAWMPEPCRSCDRRAIDHGGCRCRAFLATGDPAAGDPACSRVLAAGRSTGPPPSPAPREPVRRLNPG